MKQFFFNAILLSVSLCLPPWYWSVCIPSKTRVWWFLNPQKNLFVKYILFLLLLVVTAHHIFMQSIFNGKCKIMKIFRTWIWNFTKISAQKMVITNLGNKTLARSWRGSRLFPDSSASTTITITSNGAYLKPVKKEWAFSARAISQSWNLLAQSE